MSRYGLERHNETLLRLGERWRGILDDQRAVPDAVPAESRSTGLSKTDAGKPTLNRIVDTDRDGS